MITCILLTASCGESVTPTKEQAPTSTSLEDVTEWTDLATKISPGQHLRFDTISLEQGLSQSTVFCMLQDSQGFMWFGTEVGLNKYDGYTFTVYKHDPEDPSSLASNWISAMLEYDSETLWIGTGDGGLGRYDQTLQSFTNYRNDPDDPSSLSDDEITAIFKDQDGVLWIGTGSGLDRFDQENDRFIHYKYTPDDPNSSSSNAVSVIYEDKDGVFWIGIEDGGLNRFDRENERWWRYVNDPSDPHSLSDNTITALFEDQSGVLWVGTRGGGVEQFDQENERFIHYQHDPDNPESLSSDEIMAVYQDREGILWIGTYGGGLNRFDPEKESFVHYKNIPSDPHSLSNDIVESIFQDQEGVLWFGNLAGGVNKLDPSWRNFAIYQNDPKDPNSLGDNMVRAFFEENSSDLWIGTMFGGIDKYDRESGTWYHYHHDPSNPGSLSNDFVSVIYRDISDVLWVGTASGLDRFDPETETFTHYQAEPDESPGYPGNNVRTIYEERAGEFWIGTKGGLYQFDPEKKSWGHHYSYDPDNPDSLSNDWIFSFIKDRQGRFWIGTLGGGINRFDPDKRIFTRYQNNSDDPNSISNDIVTGIFQDRNGILWLSTAGGLDSFDPDTEIFGHFREQDGIADDSIYCALEDRDGYLWVSTNKGLSRFDPQREIFINYDATDGLQSNEFSSNACLVSDGGEIFFGGLKGFNIFSPDRVHDNPSIPPVMLTSLVQDGEEVDLGMAIDRVTEVTFKWPEDSFEFEFAALSFAHPEKNQYAYMLDGFDEDWNEIGTRRYGKYTNIPGGTYTLHLRGSNNDGIWNEQGAAVKITVVPPFWATWWFRGIALLVLVGSGYSGYWLRLRNLETRGRELEFQVEQRTARLMETQQVLRQSEMEQAITAERNRLARDLHDSVTQALYSQTLFAEATLRFLAVGKVQTATEYVDELRQTALQALQEMRLLIFELRPPVLDEEGIVAALQMRLESVEGRSGFTTEFKVEGTIELPTNIEEALFWISQEALNNIVKHAQASKVTMILKQEQHAITLDILDDGGGFDPEKQPNRGGLGLRGIQERAVQLGGQVTIESQPGRGTRVRVEVSL
ncbi:MAG: histidine kinase [Proteobacteria bacterium]|nr:histidine kinase [Pseudomonadota bacterium]